MEEIYHVLNRSIGEIEVFKNTNEYSRIINAIRYYQREKPKIRFSEFEEQLLHRGGAECWNKLCDEKIVEIITYCIMPTHFHMILISLKKGGISIFINNLLNSYTRYFNIRYHRKGTLWEGKTKKILVKTDEQFLHLTRYIHLNPVTAYLVNNAEDWSSSSYREYIAEIPAKNKICNWEFLTNISSITYKKFVEEGISYQRDMAKAKHCTAAV